MADSHQVRRLGWRLDDASPGDDPDHRANEMGASLASFGDGIVDTLANWIFDGLFVGLGAFIGVKIDQSL